MTLKLAAPQLGATLSIANALSPEQMVAFSTSQMERNLELAAQKVTSGLIERWGPEYNSTVRGEQPWPDDAGSRNYQMPDFLPWHLALSFNISIFCFGFSLISSVFFIVQLDVMSFHGPGGKVEPSLVGAWWNSARWAFGLMLVSTIIGKLQFPLAVVP